MCILNHESMQLEYLVKSSNKFMDQSICAKYEQNALTFNIFLFHILLFR